MKGFFVQFGAANNVVGIGQIKGQVGKSGDFYLVEYAGRPPYRRVFGLDAMTNFAIFETVEDRTEFLTPPQQASAPAGEVAQTPPRAAVAQPAADAEQPPAPHAEPSG